MQRDRDSGDSGALTHKLKLNKSVTSVPFVVTLLIKCPKVSPKCHSYCPQSVTYISEAK